MNDRFSMALHYSIYHLVETSLSYDDQVAKHVSKCTSNSQVRLKPKEFDPADSNSRIRFQHAFKMAYDNNSINGRTAVQLLL